MKPLELSEQDSRQPFLSALLWERTYGEGYENWRKDRWGSSCHATRAFLNHLLPFGEVKSEKRLLPHQAEALQRAIYSFENLRLSPLLITLATGTGKTVVMASIIAWLACRGDVANTFLLLCPNTIVRDRLRRDFETLAVFHDFNLFPNEYKTRLAKMSCAIVESFQNCTNLLGKNLIVANRHQFQIGYVGGKDHVAFLQKEGGRLGVFNDEAHNTRGHEYARTLAILGLQTDFRLDVTATPERADNLRPQSHEVYNLSVVEAITGAYKHNRLMDRRFAHYPPLIKDVVVQRPSIRRLGVVDTDDLYFSNPSNQQRYKVREIDWEEWPKHNIQLVMDPGGMKMQLELAFQSLEKKRAISKNRYKPLLFVIAPSIIGAEQARDMMRKDFGLNPLLVVDDESEYDKKELRDAAAGLGDPKSPYDSVVSVYMLREGWDVPEVSVICLLRGFGSPLFAQQVLGRGLRLIRRNGLESDRSIQELTVIDHPALKLDDLWAEIDALVRAGDEITRPREIDRNGEGPKSEEPKEKLPEQVVIREDLYHLLFPIPAPVPIESITLEHALEFLEQSLEQIKEQRNQPSIIVGVKADALERLRPKRSVERSPIELEVSALPSSSTDRDTSQKHLNKQLMDWAEDYAKRYRPFFNSVDLLYSTFYSAFEKYIFSGQPTTEITPETLFMAVHITPQVREAVTFELNRRIYAEEVLQNE